MSAFHNNLNRPTIDMLLNSNITCSRWTLDAYADESAYADMICILVHTGQQ